LINIDLELFMIYYEDLKRLMVFVF